MSNISDLKIYVACLSSYNNGKLHGTWIDATLHIEDIQMEIEKMLMSSPMPNAEEWEIQDSEGFDDIISTRQNTDLDDVCMHAQAILEHGDAYRKYASYNYAATPQDFENCYCGEYDSEEDYAEEMYHDCYEIPKHLECYIDWEKVARDLFMGDYYSIDSGSGVYVFNNY